MTDPAETTPDGCPVDAYAALPAEPELSIVRAFAERRPRVLDLGCGTGRIADPLAADGHVVVGVDESAEMLARLRHARPVRSRIEELELAETFDLVLALSHLVNAPDPVRAAVIATCRRHLASEGLVVLQRHDPDRRLVASDAEAIIGDVWIALPEVDDSAWPTVSATTVYRLHDRVWRQHWTSEIVDDAGIEHALRAAGLEAVTIDGAWVTARHLPRETDAGHP